MSFLNPRPENPVTKFIEFKSDEKGWFFWDKEQAKAIEVPTPFYFVVLDQFSKIGGYHEGLESGLYSNEVKLIAREKIYVRSFKGNFEMIGLYNDIKSKVKSVGGKFVKSVYALLLHKDGHELVNFQLKGSAFSAFFDLKFNERENIVCVTDELTQGQKGKTVYNIPVFKLFNMRPDVIKTAMEAAKKLQAFFETRKQQQAEQIVAETVTEVEHDEPEPEPMNSENWEEMPVNPEAQDDLPF